MLNPTLDLLNSIVENTLNKQDDFGELDANHGLIGLMGEIGEYSDIIKRHYHYQLGDSLDTDHICEEIGDMLYYIQVLLNCHGLVMEDCIFSLNAKFAKRYPYGWSRQGADRDKK